MRVARIVAPVSGLGPGTRVGLWVQGCDLACPGCASRDTWAPDGGVELSASRAADLLLAQVVACDADGLSITGGEPLQQPEAIAEVLALVRAQRPDLDVVLFTGYAEAAATRRAPDLIAACDLVIAGRYRAELPSSHPWLGSANQVLSPRTQRGRAMLVEQSGSTRRCSVTVRGRDLFLVGLPDPGDLDRFAESLRQRGIEFEATSWS